MSQLIIENAILPKNIKRSLNVISKIPERAEAIKNNETFYFTGKPCIKGHIAKRYTNNGTCHECYKLTAKKSYKNNYYKQKFNLTEGEYDLILEKQNGVCAICKEEETIIDGQTKKLKPLSVDHCHKTNKIRGLLCTLCNTGISHFKDEPYLLRQAALYCEQSQ